MNCPNCQAPVESGALLCPSCGYHVATAHQRGKVNELIAKRPDVVRRSFRSLLFLFLAMLMTVISLASLAQMVLTLIETVDTCQNLWPELYQATTEMMLTLIGVLSGQMVIALVSILTFALALASAFANWQCIFSDHRGSYANRLSAMKSYIGLQRVLAIIGAIFIMTGILAAILASVLLIISSITLFPDTPVTP